MISKVILLVPNRMPTEKAYGVTISETQKAFRLLDIECQIWCTSSSKSISLVNGEIYRTLTRNFKSPRFRIFEKSSFQWTRLKFLCLALIRIDNNASTLVWTRDSIAALLVLRFKKNTRVALELHHPVGRMDSLIIKCLFPALNKTSQNFRVFLLTPALRNSIPKKLADSFSSVIHMASPPEFYTSKRTPNPDNSITIALIGKATSSGNSNQLELIIGMLLTELRGFARLKLLIAGIEDSHINKFKSMIPSELLDSGRVVLSGHLSRAQVLGSLMKVDIGIVPYLSNKYNDFRFPIKVVEFASTSCALLASRTDSLEAILGENAMYFDLNRPDSLRNCLNELSNGRAQLEKYKILAKKWSLDYTYENRVKIVLSSF